MARALINHKSINLKLKKAVTARSASIKPKLEKAKKKAFQEFLQDFKNHPVTMEISEGPHGSNISGTLGGYGNLFSFIGFSDGDSPTKVIEAYVLNQLRKSIKIIPDTKSGGWRVVMQVPSMEDIASITPMPWAGGRSWVVGIHSGISGLGSYLFSERAGRYNSASGTAIQVRGKMRGGTFQNTPYMVPMLKLFTKRLRENVKIMARL
tara:strand:+ start:988 stop:1611 length:624 start_codon:yes stop_codon:yes gene_type:complete